MKGNAKQKLELLEMSSGELLQEAREMGFLRLSFILLGWVQVPENHVPHPHPSFLLTVNLQPQCRHKVMGEATANLWGKTTSTKPKGSPLLRDSVLLRFFFFSP